MEVRIPELGTCLLLEPLLHYKQAIYDACLVLLFTRSLCRGQHRIGEDGTMRLCDLLLLKLARNDLFNLVFQTKGNLGDFFRVDGWGG